MAEDQGWPAALADRCECQLCQRLGDESPHRGESHDQSLDQRFELKSKASLRIRGGTTKCARVMMRFFERGEHLVRPGSRVLEVGTGTALVGLTLLHLGCRVRFTDQEPVLDMVRLNVNANLPDFGGDGAAAPSYEVATLQWGEGDPVAGTDFVVGSDLIFASENIAPLVRTFEAHALPTYLASIRRFDWEDRFFELMEARFSREVVHADGDIEIFLFTPKPPAPESQIA